MTATNTIEIVGTAIIQAGAYAYEQVEENEEMRNSAEWQRMKQQLEQVDHTIADITVATLPTLVNGLSTVAGAVETASPLLLTLGGTILAYKTAMNWGPTLKKELETMKNTVNEFMWGKPENTEAAGEADLPPGGILETEKPEPQADFSELTGVLAGIRQNTDSIPTILAQLQSADAQNRPQDVPEAAADGSPEVLRTVLDNIKTNTDSIPTILAQLQGADVQNRPEDGPDAPKDTIDRAQDGELAKLQATVGEIKQDTAHLDTIANVLQRPQADREKAPEKAEKAEKAEKTEKAEMKETAIWQELLLETREGVGYLKKLAADGNLSMRMQTTALRADVVRESPAKNRSWGDPALRMGRREMSRQTKSDRSRRAGMALGGLQQGLGVAGMVLGAADMVANLTGVADSGLGVIVGGLNVAWEALKNVGLVAANVFLGVRNVFDAMKQQVVNVLMALGSDVIYHFYTLKGNFWELVLNIAEAVNALPFVEIDTSGIAAHVEANRLKAEDARLHAEALRQQNEQLTVKGAFQEGFATYEAFGDGWAQAAMEEGAARGDAASATISGVMAQAYGAADTIEPVRQQELDRQVQQEAGLLTMERPQVDTASQTVYHPQTGTCTLDRETADLLRQVLVRETVPEEHVTNNYAITMNNTMHVREEADVNKIMRKMLDQLWEAADSGSDRVSIRFGR